MYCGCVTITAGFCFKARYSAATGSFHYSLSPMGCVIRQTALRELFHQQLQIAE